MSSEIKVTVIMPSLNVHSYIRPCVESVINQTLENLEILCIDAGSTDGTLEILQEYEAKDQRIRLIRSDRKSYGYQVNLGIRAAKGEYLAIVETDDYIRSTMVERLTELADQYRLDVIKADYQSFRTMSGKPEFTWCRIMPEDSFYNRVIDATLETAVLNPDTVPPWAGIYRTDFFRDNNILLHESPGASFQDTGLWFQVFTQAKRLIFLNEAFYCYRTDNPGSSVKSREKVYLICQEYDFIREFLRSKPELEKKYVPYCTLYRYRNYVWNLQRISDEFRMEFLKRFQEDFDAIEQAGELDKSVFSRMRWVKYQMIRHTPKLWYDLTFRLTGVDRVDQRIEKLRIKLKLKEAEDKRR